MKAESLTKKPERSAYWDIAKCLLIILVTLGHLVQYGGWSHGDDFYHNALFKLVYMFHMPMFALICGFFAAAGLRKYGGRTLPRYALRFLLPSVTYSVLYMVFGQVRGGLWFLVVMFECVVAYYILTRIPNRAARVALACMAFPIVALIYMGHIERFFPVIYYFIWLWPFFALGGVLSAFSFTEKSINIYWLLAVPLYLILEPYFEFNWFVYATPFNADPGAIKATIIRTLVAMLGCIGFMGMCRWLLFLARVPLVLRIGRATMGVYVLQIFFFNHLSQYVGRVTGLSTNVGSLLVVLPLTLVLYGLYELLSRIALINLLLFGKQTFIK